MPMRLWRRPPGCRKSFGAKCARASRKTTASRRRSTGPWAYYSRFRSGGQRRIYCRKPRQGGAEIVLIDGDARAEGKAFFHFAGGRHSPDHAKFAWSSDDLGSEILTIAVRDLERQRDLADRIRGATGDVVWTGDSTAFLYVEQDENHRPRRVMLHRLETGQSDDVEVFVEDDPAWFIGIEPTRLGATAIISVHGHDASEALVVDLDHPMAAPRLVAPHRPGIRYEVMDHGDRFFIRTNAGAPDFKILIAAARGAAGGELARFRRRARRTIHRRRDAVQGSPRAPHARDEPAAPRRHRPQKRRLA